MLILPVSTAATTHSPTNTSSYAIPQLLVFISFIIVFYFLVWRPQAKRQQEKQALLSDLRVGDVIYTTSGIVGKIVSLHQNFCEIEVASNTRFHIQREAITEVVPKGSLKSLGF